MLIAEVGWILLAIAIVINVVPSKMGIISHICDKNGENVFSKILCHWFFWSSVLLSTYTKCAWLLLQWVNPVNMQVSRVLQSWHPSYLIDGFLYGADLENFVFHLRNSVTLKNSWKNFGILLVYDWCLNASNV